MRPLAEAAIRAGLIDEETLAQFRRWGFVPRDLEPGELDREESVEAIMEALEAEEQVRLQHTDLDLLRYYMDENNQRKGQLVLINPDLDQRATKTVTFACRVRSGQDEYIVPYMSEGITEMLDNGRSYLRWSEAGPSGKMTSRRTYLTNPQDMYFGDMLLFLLCEGMEDEDGDS